MQNYTVTIEVDDKKPLVAADVDRITDELEAFSPALGNSARGFRSATLSVPGQSLRQAVASAVAVVEAAMGAHAIVCEAMTEDEFDTRQGWAPTPELVSVSEAAELLGVSRQRVLQRIKERSLPATQVGRDYVIPRAAVVTAGRKAEPS
ncbi:excisionase family DNA-binding protein [Nocardioides sp. SYSU D00065]|uniref:excisionase family DNA-binding protein n=1 Tax=Nocardioides sp. SYSU D00065 TaxID=2817378 RepID=UPI001B3437BF|nr:helix-turn-helix domain-containing protein [Nocardioides sp. SYSU D00065]